MSLPTSPIQNSAAQSIIDEEGQRSIQVGFLEKFKTRIKYYIPILRWLPKYDYRKDLIHDIKAGITVALLIIPQSLSYSGSLSKLEPVDGLYSCFSALIVYGILGTSRQLSVGPEALVSLLVGNTISQTVGISAPIEDRLSISSSLSLLVGIITFLLGLFRMGFMDSVLSRALLRGFITAIAMVIFFEQLPLLIGLPSDVDLENANPSEEFQSPAMKFINILRNLQKGNIITFIISLLSISILFGLSFVKNWITAKFSAEYHDNSSYQPIIPVEDVESFARHTVEFSMEENVSRTKLPLHYQIIMYTPEILVVVVLGEIFAFAFDLSSSCNVSILGKDSIHFGYAKPILPTITAARLNKLITPALLISVLGFVESIVGSKKFAGKYQYIVSANRELVALGTLNLFGSVMNSFPAFGAIARSQINDNAGARTQMAGLITGIIVFLTLMFMLPIFYYLPHAVMASIVLVAAFQLLEFEDVLFMIKIRAWGDLFLTLITFLSTILWSVESGTLISIALSLSLVIKHSTAPKISILGKIIETEASTSSGQPPKIKFRPIDEIFREKHSISNEDMEILIVRIDEGLFFANTGQIKDRLRRAEVYGGWIHVHPSEEERRPLKWSTGNIPFKRRVKAKNEADLESPAGEGYDAADSSSASKDNENNVQNMERIEGTLGVPMLKAVIFDIENMPSIDASAIQVLIEIVEDYHDRGVEVCFVKLREAIKGIFLRSGLLGDLLGSDKFFRKISDAETFLRQKWGQIQTFPSQQQVESESKATNSNAPTSFSSYSVL